MTDLQNCLNKGLSCSSAVSLWARVQGPGAGRGGQRKHLQSPQGLRPARIVQVALGAMAAMSPLPLTET